MKKIFILLCLVIMNSATCAGPASLRGLFGSAIGDTFPSVIRRIGTMAKSKNSPPSQSTDGFRPEKQAPLRWHVDNIADVPVRFLDPSGERYLPLRQAIKPTPKMKESTGEQKDAHTLLVDLKKNFIMTKRP